MLDRLFDQFDRLALEEAVYKVCERACLRVHLFLLLLVPLAFVCAFSFSSPLSLSSLRLCRSISLSPSLTRPLPLSLSLSLSFSRSPCLPPRPMLKRTPATPPVGRVHELRDPPAWPHAATPPAWPHAGRGKVHRRNSQHSKIQAMQSRPRTGDAVSLP